MNIAINRPPGGRAIRLDVDNDDRRLLIEIQPLAEPLGQAHLLRAHTQVGSRMRPRRPSSSSTRSRCGRMASCSCREAPEVLIPTTRPCTSTSGPQRIQIERQIEAEGLAGGAPCCPPAPIALTTPSLHRALAQRKHDVTDADGNPSRQLSHRDVGASTSG